MDDWSGSASVPAFSPEHARRRRSMRRSVPLDVDPADAVLALGVLSAHLADLDRVVVPVHRDGSWSGVSIQLDPVPSTTSLRRDISSQLATPTALPPPPEGRICVVFGDTVIDSSHLALRIDTDLLELSGPVEPAGAVSLLAARYRWLLEEMLQGRSLTEIGKVAPAEHPDLERHRNGPQLGTLSPVVDRIERAARRAPHTPAISTPWVTWTYDELLVNVADRSAMLARSGVERGSTVGLALQRSTDLVATVLALWRLGVAFVPIDETQSRDQILSMLRDARAGRMVTDLSPDRLVVSPVPTVGIDRKIHERRLRRRDANPELDELALVPFTHATGGRPRGVVVTHRNLAQFVLSVSGVMPRRRWPCVMLATTPLAEGQALMELVWPLTEGWEVVIDPGGGSPLAPVARRRRATHLKATPSIVSAMSSDRDGREVLDAVDHILLGGQPVRAEFLTRLATITRAEVMVCYGQVETTVDAVWGPADRTVARGVMPIGQPLPGRSVDIIDSHGRRVGAFGIGELVIEGGAVSSGYIDDPGHRETDSPFSERAGLPRYRTGDVVWSDSAGVIHLVGENVEASGVTGSTG